VTRDTQLPPTYYSMANSLSAILGREPSDFYEQHLFHNFSETHLLSVLSTQRLIPLYHYLNRFVYESADEFLL
jgi:hypothetical protein